MSKLLAHLEKSKEFWFLLFTLFGFFLLRLPSLFEPYWYGDEGIYEVIGLALRQGRLLYQGIADNKPPLLYLVYALFSGDQAPAKFLSMLAGMGAIIVFFLLAKKLFTQPKVIFVTTGIFAFLFGIPLLEGNIANSENFMILPITLAGYMIVRTISHNAFEKPYKKEALAFLYSGLLLGIAFLFKIVAVFDLAAFALFTFFVLYKKHVNFFGAILKVIPLGIGFFIPLLITIGYFAMHGILNEFFHFVFNNNVGYVNYGNQLIIPQGLLILKLLLLGTFCLWLFLKREKFSTTTLFILIWLGFSLFDAFFSQRPYTHYLLVLLSSLMLFVGLIMQEQKRQKQLLVLFLVLLFILTTNFDFYSKTLGYYTNFISFMVGAENATAYRTFFDANTARDYDIAMFFEKNKKPGDTLFVWGDDGQLYKLVNQLPPGRFIVAYHAAATPSTLKETRDAVIAHPPRFIVVIPNKPPLPFSLANYSEIAILQGAVIYARND